MKFFALILLLFNVSFSDELRSLTNRGISAYKKGNFEKALEFFGSALEKYPLSNEARFNKGLALGATGNAKEAEAMLSSVRFDRADRNAEVLFARARIAEAVGDAALSNQEQPNISEARKAYQAARSLYAQSLDLKRDRKTVNNIEILSQKIKHLPEEDPNEQNEQNQDGQDDNDNQDKQDNQDNNDDRQNQDEKNDGDNQDNQQNEKNEEDEQQREQRQREEDERIEDAIRLLEHYADDARELNRPPVQKAIPPADGRNW